MIISQRYRSIGAVGLMIVSFVVALSLAGPSCSSQPRYAQAPVSGSDVIIELAALPTDVPQFFTLPASPRPVSFFVIKMSNGVQSYLDACVTCYHHKRGYAYREGKVVCRKCNMDFSIYKLEKGVGGCYPIKIAGRTEDGVYRIPVSELEKHVKKF